VRAKNLFLIKKGRRNGGVMFKVLRYCSSTQLSNCNNVGLWTWPPPFLRSFLFGIFFCPHLFALFFCWVCEVVWKFWSGVKILLNVWSGVKILSSWAKVMYLVTACTYCSCIHLLAFWNGDTLPEKDVYFLKCVKWCENNVKLG